MSFQAIEHITLQELELRHERLRSLLVELCPEAGGLLAFSRQALYYCSGTMANGVFWLPLEGEPVLLCRRGLERARLESPLTAIEFRSFSDLAAKAANAGAPLAKTLGVEMGGLSWSLGQLLRHKLSDHDFASADTVLARGRSVKTDWELSKMRLAGARHHHCLYELTPGRIRPGMTEREISHVSWEIFFSQGHSGVMRMNGFGEEIFLGHVAAGKNALYPSVFNGPVGLMGEHPAAPFMGYAGAVWRENEPLTMDIGFCLEGYQTDKTQVYWVGASHCVPDDFARAHDFCVDAQAELARGLVPGALCSDLYNVIMAKAEEAGYLDGFMALDGNKVKFLGHGIGLAIDEYPVLAGGFDVPLEEGMVLALEPKMGVRGVGMVGVENTFEVTPAGGRCLTGDAFDMVPVEGA